MLTALPIDVAWVRLREVIIKFIFKLRKEEFLGDALIDNGNKDSRLPQRQLRRADLSTEDHE